MSVVGARPQFVKLAPISRAIEAAGNIQHRVVHTGQHYDANMSESFFEQLEMRAPDVNLEVGSGTHAEQSSAMLTALETLLTDDRPSAVLTYGDTNSTLAATLAAAKIHVPVAHVEAGLRSYNRAMPEEINRLVADHCSDRLYAPTPQSMANLESENISDRAIVSGDVMLDAVQHNIELARQNSRAMDNLGLEPGRFGLVTVHRPVNTTGEALRQLLDALEETAVEHLPLVFPVHPRTRAILDRLDYTPPGPLVITAPLTYLDNLRVMQEAAVVITDSGGVQKEAAFLGTPCLTARDETEWTETVEIGVNRLVGNAGRQLIGAVVDVLEQGSPFNETTRQAIEQHYGAGDAAERIVFDCIAWIREAA